MAFLVLSFLSACGVSGPFDPEAQPPAADYTLASNWMCDPAKVDFCDLVPLFSGLIDEQESAEVDCFALQPTSYLDGNTWNADINYQGMRNLANLIGKSIFTAFNGSCRIYAPHYRQVHLKAFMEPGDFAEGPMAVAYEDVEASFDYYLEEIDVGRSLVLVGHSQGSKHMERLIRERVLGTELQDRLVVAYLIGGELKPQAKMFGTSIPYCQSASSFGCITGYRTLALGATAGAFTRPLDGLQCTNPLSWQMNGQPEPASKNAGSADFLFTRMAPNECGARCREDGYLELDTALPPAPYFIFQGDYHMADYGLFWLNLRQNVAERISAFQQESG